MNVFNAFTIFIIAIGGLVNAFGNSVLADRVEKLEAQKNLLCIQLYKIESKHNYVLECSGVLK